MIKCFVMVILTGIISAAEKSEWNITKLLSFHKYPIEVHEVETEDGYLLDVYGIPYSILSNTKKANKYPVIMMHGLLGSAENSLITGPTKALTYKLVDNGYDVWFCNARGTWHSRKHKSIDRNCSLVQNRSCKMMALCVFITVVLLNYVLAIKPTDLDMNISNMTEMITKNGYPIEWHEIETEDGYILGIYRIPYGRKSRTKQTNKYPVIVMHGMMVDADSFFIIGPGKALGYTLADNGYDVWLCNARGTRHSRKHINLDPDKDSTFWQFSWHEIGMYDLPAVIDYVLNSTNNQKLHYVGHSQGGTTFFVMCSEKPEYNGKIKVAISLSGAVFTNNIRLPIIKLVVPFYNILEYLAKSFNYYEVPSSVPKIVLPIQELLCGQKSTSLVACKKIIEFIGGFKDEQLDLETIPLITANALAGASVYQLFHFSRVVVTGKFQEYDWGKQENLRRYRYESPREYNLSNVSAPVALFYSGNDVVDEKDVLHLAAVLPNVVELYKVPYEQWTHLDFIWAKNIDSLLHKRVLQGIIGASSDEEAREKEMNKLDFIVLIGTSNAVKKYNRDTSMNDSIRTEIVPRNGYPIERHEIETEDGYILGIYRIPYGRRSTTNQTNKYPVVVMHGMLVNAESYLITGPDKALGYTLADNGYDVWLCNARGNNHSRKHKNLNPDKDKRFWQFSWHEIGVYDIPAVIDYVLKITNNQKLHYVGHSQGGTAFAVMGSERPEYNKKIKVAICLSAVVFMKTTKVPFFNLGARFYHILEDLATFFNFYEIPSTLPDILNGIPDLLCGQNSTTLDMCKSLIGIFGGGFNDDQLQLETIPLITAISSGGASVYQLFHYSQVIVSGVFQEYDWGKQENQKRYGYKSPREYYIRNVTAPVALFYSKNDIVEETDVLHLAEVLPNVVELYKVPYENWTHLDFIWAKDIDVLLHKKVLQVMKKFNDV